MKSLDTNVLARYVLQDDANQAALAEAVLSEPCFITDTVILELAWLLSSIYRIDRPDLGALLLELISLPNVTVANSALLSWAIERFLAGADLADMIHIVASAGTEGFVSFERRLGQLAGPQTPVPIARLA